MTHTLTVAALALLFLFAMTLLVAVVVCTEPGALERYVHGLAYHRSGGRHARPRPATTLPALTQARTA